VPFLLASFVALSVPFSVVVAAPFVSMAFIFEVRNEMVLSEYEGNVVLLVFLYIFVFLFELVSTLLVLACSNLGDLRRVEVGIGCSSIDASALDSSSIFDILEDILSLDSNASALDASSLLGIRIEKS